MKIFGNIDEIRFSNQDNGFHIIVLDVEGEPVVAVGTFPPVTEGEDLELIGEYVNHPKFGRQFKVSSVVKGKPRTLDGIVRFLGSGIVRGIGPKTALAIVDAFGMDTLDVIEKHPSMLKRVRGVTIEKAIALHDAYVADKAMQDAIMYLVGQGLGMSLSLKVYKTYREDTIKLVTANPYRMIEDVDGVGFSTADKIAIGMGIERNSVFRIRAGIIYVLKENGEHSGNTYLPKMLLIEQVAHLLGIAVDGVEDVLTDLDLDRRVKIVEINDVAGVFLHRNYKIESGAAVKLMRLIDSSNKMTYDIRSDIAEFERINNITLHAQQAQAVECAINSGVCVITGGPGTGKTTIVKCILNLLDKLNIQTSLMAPTGRAAKRLSESTGREAMTIHRALMTDGGDMADGPKVNAGAVIIDEVSMMDIFLFNVLITRLAQSTRLILVGDADQLPSVGAGNVLADIIACEQVSCVKLTHIYRQAEQSLIVSNAHAVNRGEMPVLDNKDKDFFFVKASSAEQVASKISALVERRLPGYLGVTADKIQVLCPMKNGQAGTNNINAMLQSKLNNQGRSLVTEDGVYRVGDKVMHTTNNYQLEWTRFAPVYETGSGVFNGDLGKIESIEYSTGEITVLFEDNRRVVYSQDIRSQLMLAYAVTVHKSQGSEFDAVVMPVMPGNPSLLTRNLLYTAITRARRMVVLVGEEYGVRRMVENDYIATRYSGLDYFIRKLQSDSIDLFKKIDFAREKV